MAYKWIMLDEINNGWKIDTVIDTIIANFEKQIKELPTDEDLADAKQKIVESMNDMDEVKPGSSEYENINRCFKIYSERLTNLQKELAGAEYLSHVLVNAKKIRRAHSVPSYLLKEISSLLSLSPYEMYFNLCDTLSKINI